jgi:hypothetical protein
MKTRTLTLLLVLQLFLNSSFKNEPAGLSLFNHLRSPENGIGFKLVKSCEDVNIYTRWLPDDKNRSLRQIKAEFTVTAPMDRIVTVLEDDSSYPEWMSSIKEYRRIKTLDSTRWYCYIQFSVPWPLNNQDCIFRYEVMKNPAAGKTVIEFYGEPGYLPAKEGVDRISHMEACWEITETDNGKTRITYYVFSRQAPKFPIWLTEPIIQKTLLKTMVGLREVILSRNSYITCHEN